MAAGGLSCNASLSVECDRTLAGDFSFFEANDLRKLEAGQSLPEHDGRK
jgi:hypothetical protein